MTEQLPWTLAASLLEIIVRPLPIQLNREHPFSHLDFSAVCGSTQSLHITLTEDPESNSSAARCLLSDCLADRLFTFFAVRSLQYPRPWERVTSVDTIHDTIYRYVNSRSKQSKVTVRWRQSLFGGCPGS
jgi:hypothetical protein